MEGHKLLIPLIIFGMSLTGRFGKRIPSFAGPYRVIMNTINNQTDEYNSTGKIWARLYTTHPKPKQLQYIWGNIHIGIEISDNLRGEVRMSQWSNNQWKRNAFVLRFGKACTDGLFHARFFGKIMYGTEELPKCPLPKCSRHVSNQTINPAFPQFPVIPYGRYLYTLAIINGGETVGVVVADASAVPKL